MAQVVPAQPGTTVVVVTAPGAGGAPVAATYDALLNQAPEFKISQTRKGCIQELFGCDANSQFKFIINGAHVGMIDEESSCLIRYCCKGNRPWETKMRAGQASEGTEPILHFTRPFRCMLGQCKCCCYQEVSVKDPAGNSLGTTTESFWACVPNFHVKDGAGTHEFDLHMPTCCGGMCVNVCAEGCCSCRIPFYFYPPNGKDDEVLISTGSTPSPAAPGDTPKAQITKIWTGLGQELFTDADTFECKCPDGADAGKKARIIGATLLINQLFFEKDAGAQPGA